MPKTIFILGAGASHAYGFPLGQGLVDEIINTISPVSRTGQTLNFNMQSKLVNILLRKFGGTFMWDFVCKLRDSETNSIDFFLSHNMKYREIGKLCIAYLILDHQRRLQNANKIKGGWYKLLWSEINSIDIDKFDFSIYTFNYDRSLSLYLKKSIMNMFGWVETDLSLQQYMEKIPITHLHGSVDIEAHGYQIEPLFEILTYDHLIKISAQISVIYEAEINDAFKKFHADIRYAEHIVFLGFGFHPDNIKRLQLTKSNLNGVKVFSTAFGMSELQAKTKIEGKLKEFLISNYTKYKIGNKSYDCEEFLKNELSFQSLFKN